MLEPYHLKYYTDTLLVKATAVPNVELAINSFPSTFFPHNSHTIPQLSANVPKFSLFPIFKFRDVSSLPVLQKSGQGVKISSQTACKKPTTHHFDTELFPPLSRLKRQPCGCECCLRSP